MNILYLDLNEISLIEDYSLLGTKYGAGSCVAKYWILQDTNFYLAARYESIKDISRQDRCIRLSEEDIQFIREGFPLENIEPLKPIIKKFDIIIHHFTNIWINTDGLDCKSCCWAVGLRDFIHPKNTNLLLYSRKFQKPIISNPNTKIFDIQLGREIADECPSYKKSDYICQISRHNNEFGSAQVASWCVENKVRGFFGGPIDGKYPLLDYIDNKYTKYLGIVTNKVKEYLTKHARLYTLLYNWDVPFSISMLESLNFGCPVLTTKRGFTKSIINHGKNGFFLEDSSVSEAYNMAPMIYTSDCWESAAKYNVAAMLDSFKEAFKQL